MTGRGAGVVRRAAPVKRSATLAPVLSEKRFQSQVEKVAALKGWVTFHVYSSRRCLPGWPDLILLRPPIALAWELKTATGRVTPEQTAMLALLAACGFDARVVRPKDWDDVMKVLA